MNWKKRARLGCILLSNGTISFFALRLLLAYGAETRREVRVDRVLGAILCLWCLLGAIAEIFHHSWARRINIALPISIAVFMISTLVWLPLVTSDGDRLDAALGFALFAVAPMCLALFSYFAYRLTTAPDSEHNRSISGA
jgi:hypothetical protein